MKTLERKIIAFSCLLLLSLISFSARNSLALPTFSIDGPKEFDLSIVSIYDVGHYFVIRSLVAGTQTLNVQIINPDEHVGFVTFSYNDRQEIPLPTQLTIVHDSTGAAWTYIRAQYKKLSRTTFETKIVLSDANGTTFDTIIVRPGVLGIARDKDILSVDYPDLFKVGTGVNKLNFTVHNNGTVAAYVKFDTWVSDSILVGVQPFTIDAGGSHLLTIDLKVNDRSPDQALTDSLDFTLTPITPPEGKIKNVTFNFKDTIKRYYAPELTIPTFWENAGQKSCKQMHITNRNSDATTITGIDLTGIDASVFTFEPALSLPLTIAANSNVELRVCATAPTTHNQLFQAILEATYSNDGGITTKKTGAPIYGHTGDCVTIDNDTIIMGPLLAGGTVDASATITNSLGKPITFTNSTWEELFNGSTSHFAITNVTYPFTLAANESKTLNIHLTTIADTNGYYLARYVMHYGPTDDNCTLRSILLLGTAVNADDTNMLNLFPSQTEIMPIESNQQTTSKRFTFINNSGSPVKVLSVSVVDGTHFSVTSPLAADLPITMANNVTLEVDITFNANSTGFYNDSLVIVTDHGLKSQAFSLQGLRNGIASVASELQLQPEITLLPNPASSQVVIATSGLRSAMIEIYDVLGNKIASQNTTGSWLWSITNTGVTDGTYFVRANGLTTDGKTFVQTKRLVVTR